MEGFVNIKSSFSLNIKGAKTQVWAVLDGCQFSYYRKFDFSQQKPVDVRGALLIKETTQITKCSDLRCEIVHGLDIKTEKGCIFIDCVTSEACSSWYNALTKAMKLEKEEEERQSRPEKLRIVLEIDPNVKLSRSIITKAYKKLSLKAHPDKGGDPTAFNAINQCYNALLAIQAVEDERENSDIIHFEVDVRKSITGQGFGIVFSEDPTRRQVIVNDTKDTIDIVGITEDGGEGLRVGDALIGIDNDDCSHWFLSRIRARLSPMRYNDGDIVRFTFERLVPKSSGPFGRNEPISMPPSPSPAGTESHSPVKVDLSSSPSPTGFSAAATQRFVATEVEEKNPLLTHPVELPQQESASGRSDQTYNSNSSNSSNSNNNNRSSKSRKDPVIILATTAVALPPVESVSAASSSSTTTWQSNSAEQVKQTTFKAMETISFAEDIAPLPPDNSKWKKLKEENDDLKEQLRKFQEKDNRVTEIMEFKDRKISALEAESVASNLSIQKLVDEKSSLAFENGELKFRVASLMKIVDSFCHGKASDRKQIDYIVALSDKLAAAQRELREVSTLLATARYSFRVEDERIQESNLIGGGDPRDRLAGDTGAKSTQPDAHSRMRVDWNNDRVQRAKKLENQLVAALLKEN